MAGHADILDRRERILKPFFGSALMHAGIVAALVGINVAGHRRADLFGDPHGGGFGVVAVNPTSRIPLPNNGGPVNPVANDTESAVPTPPPKSRPAPKVKAPDPNAIPIKSRNAPRRRSDWASELNKWRKEHPDAANQLYSSAGQRASTPMYGITGGGGVNAGANASPFGSRFGYYAEILRSTLSRHWNTSDVDARLKKPPAVVVVFTIQKNGTVPVNSVRIVQRSGNPALDYSVLRAVYDSSPFPPLPAGFERNEALVEYTFNLER